MASRTALLIAATMAVVVVVALLPTTASSAVYRVGNDSGWSLGVDYNTWASDKEFHKGDILEFVYSKGSHNVVLVDATGYETCTAVPSDARMLTSGADRVELGDAAGHFFFICTFEGHCESGMKLRIDIPLSLLLK